MKLALIRHGATAWNLEKRIQGRVDQPLCDTGRRQLQALKLPPVLQAYRWYTSPLKRATETAQLLDIDDVCIEPALIETSWGDWEGKILKQLRRQLGDEMRSNEMRGLDFCPPGGESPRQVQLRLQSWLEQIVESSSDSGAIAHQGIIRCIYALACGWDMCGEAPIDFAWDAAHQFELTNDGSLANGYQSIPLNRRLRRGQS